MTAMSKKKSKSNPESKKGRPASELSKRYMIRTTNEDLGKWEALAEHENLGNASVLARKALNDRYTKAIGNMSPSDRKRVEARAAELCAAHDAAA